MIGAMDIPSMHREQGSKSAAVFVLTCSTSRAEAKRKGLPVEDPSGDTIEKLIREAGHRVTGRVLIPDNIALLRTAIRQAMKSDADVIIVTGGTGISPSDVTIEVIVPMFEKELPGFGELFRKISYDTIGSAAMMTRATAGVVRGKAIFCLPGSPDAVRTAVTKLIVPELGHVLSMARQGKR
jgi:molybdenum cofactor biosynthesis protein B